MKAFFTLGLADEVVRHVLTILDHEHSSLLDKVGVEILLIVWIEAVQIIWSPALEIVIVDL